MKKLHKEIYIEAPREKVWDTMIGDATYREWTAAFCPGSYYKGDWSEGSKILFLGPDPKGGAEGGMVSRIAENKMHEFISIEHLGVIKDGVEDTNSDYAKAFAGAKENYTFKDNGSGTDLHIDMDMDEKEMGNMEEMWDNALVKLKAICESK